MAARGFVIFCILAAATFVAVILATGELPPNKIRLAVGSAGSSYEIAAQKLKKVLAKSGVTAELVQTQGAEDNLKRLVSTDKDAIDAALMQSGRPETQTATGIANLGAVFLQPIWVFGRNLPPGIDVHRLIGKKVAAGTEQSNTRRIATMLLAENGIDEKDLTLVALKSEDAVDALLKGKIDALWMVGSVDSHWVQTLLASPELELVSFDRAAAYARRHSFLVDVVLAEGAIDLARNMPGHDLKLVGPTAQLIVREKLHPALQSLMLDAMRETFSDGDAVSAPGMYPNKDLIDIPLSSEARRYYASGPSFFRRYLPYWAANFAERAVLFLIPLFTLLLPVAQAAPPILDWRIKSKIHKWYRQLRLLETRFLGADNKTEREDIRQKLDAMIQEVGLMKVPLSFADDVYRLRAHIRFVAESMSRQMHEA